MAIDQRRQIFELREQGLSERKIAEQLGVSSSKVHRELNRRAPEVRAQRELEQPGSLNGNGFHAAVDVVAELPPLPPALAGDPALVAERAELEREQLALRRAQLRSQRLEAERRVQLLQNPDASGGGGLAAVVLQILDRNREDTRALIQQLSARQAAPPPPAPSLSDQLAQARQWMDTIASYAPAKSPSSATDLEFEVAKQRLQMESQDLVARREAELADKRAVASAEARRNDAVASAIESFGPVLGKAVEMWFEERQQGQTPRLPPPAYPPAPGDEQLPPPARPHVVQDELEGQCPNCQAGLAMTAGQDEKCPKCGATLAVIEGRIRVRMANGALWPPLQTG